MSHYSTLKGLGRAIAYFPQLGIHLGNPLAGIFLSQLVYWHDKTDCELGVYKTSEEWQKETGLTYSHQKTARKLLKELGILSETEKRLEHKLYFKLNTEKFDEWFEKCVNSDQNRESKMVNSRTRNPSFGDEQKHHSGVKESFDRGEAKSASVIHNITTENTTESISAVAPSKTQKFSAKEILIKNGVSEQTISEYTNLRNKKKKPITENVLKLVFGQAKQACISNERAFQIIVVRGWETFKVAWNWQETNAELDQLENPQQIQFEQQAATQSLINLPSKPKGFLGGSNV